MTVLVFGKTGQVATELQKHADVTALGRADVDLTIPGDCAKAIQSRSPRAVINAAAYTAVDRAEEEQALAHRVNAEAPAAMARACADMDIPFVQISTDYVFDGNGHTPRHPTDTTAPINSYGRTKLLGEQAVREAGGRYVILRTSWVFSAHGANFVKTIVRLAETRDALTIVGDQIGGPTPANAIAQACLSIAEQLTTDAAKAGIYHFSGAPDASWYDFAKDIVARTNRTPTVEPIPTSSYPTPASRPLNSRLDCTLTETTFGLPRPDWRAALDQVLEDLEKTT